MPASSPVGPAQEMGPSDTLLSSACPTLSPPGLTVAARTAHLAPAVRRMEGPAMPEMLPFRHVVVPGACGCSSPGTLQTAHLALAGWPAWEEVAMGPAHTCRAEHGGIRHRHIVYTDNTTPQHTHTLYVHLCVHVGSGCLHTYTVGMFMCNMDLWCFVLLSCRQDG